MGWSPVSSRYPGSRQTAGNPPPIDGGRVSIHMVDLLETTRPCLLDACGGPTYAEPAPSRNRTLNHASPDRISRCTEERELSTASAISSRVMPAK